MSSSKKAAGRPLSCLYGTAKFPPGPTLLPQNLFDTNGEHTLYLNKIRSNYVEKKLFY